MFFESMINEGKRVDTIKLDRGLIYPIQTSGDLLKDVSYQKYIDQVKLISKKYIENAEASFDEYFFNTLYKDLIHRFVEFVQVLPDSTGRDIYMNRALLRALWSLESYIRKSERDVHSDGDILPYAIFSSALLFQVGEIFSEVQIQLVDQNGIFKANWNPLDGPMTNFHCEWFRQRPVSKHPVEMIHQMTVIIATKILPELGYQWIAQDRTILEWWYDALIDQYERLGQFDIDLNMERDFVHRSRLKQIDVQGLLPHDLINAEEFLEWIKKCNEEKQKQNITGADTYVTRRGLLISEKALKAFADKHKVSVNQLSKHLIDAGLGYGQRELEEYVVRHGNESQRMFGGGPVNEVVRGIMVNKHYARIQKDATTMTVISKSVGGYIAKFLQIQEQERENKLDSKRSPGKTGI